MATLSVKSGKCSNFGNCSLADARTSVEVPTGQDFVCTECGKPLLLMDAGPQSGGNSKALAMGLVLLVLVLAAGGIAWSLLAGKKSPEPAAPAVVVTPPVPAELPKNPPQAELPAKPPITGNCSEADERAGLCRIAR